MIPIGLLNQTVTVKRRTSTGRDSLNNPIYGSPTSGAGWNTVYNNMPCRTAFNTKLARFAHEGERVEPTGVVYYNTPYALQVEDRILTTDGIEYTVISIVSAYMIGNTVDHYEAIVQLP